MPIGCEMSVTDIKIHYLCLNIEYFHAHFILITRWHFMANTSNRLMRMMWMNNTRKSLAYRFIKCTCEKE